jgi:SAM-dependent methyltransferase
VLRPLYGHIESFLVRVLPGTAANLLQTYVPDWRNYYRAAERNIEDEWNEIIWPHIKDFDFDAVLELAPGWGRSTERLCEHAKTLYAVDFKSAAIDGCRERLGDSFKGCNLVYAINNGQDLRMIKSESISTVYCWDSAVHFGREILASYIREFARVLKPGGKGFVHHSNMGCGASKNIKATRHWRSNVDKAFVTQLCWQSGLTIEAQTDIPWAEIIDCATVFKKPCIGLRTDSSAAQ